MSEQDSGVIRLYRIKEEFIHQLQEKTPPPLYAPTVIATTLDHACLTAAWVMFTHISIETHISDETFQRGSFRYDVWLLDASSPVPSLLWSDTVYRRYPAESEPCMRCLAQDIDRVSVDKQSVYVRDWRVLTNNKDAAYPIHWRTYPRLSS